MEKLSNGQVALTASDLPGELVEMYLDRDIKQLEAENKLLRAVAKAAKAIEYIEFAEDGEYESHLYIACPECLRSPGAKHRKECELGKTLAALAKWQEANGD